MGITISGWKKYILVAKPYVKFAADVSDAVNSLVEAKKFRNIISSSLRAVDTVLSSEIVQKSSNKGAWIHIDSARYGIRKSIIDALSRFPKEQVINSSSSEEDEAVEVFSSYNVYGVKIAPSYPGNGGATSFFLEGVDSDYFQEVQDSDIREKSDLAESALGRAIWECYGPRVELISTKEDDYEIQAVKQRNLLPSPTASNILARLKPFHDAGKSRGVILYGRAGSGKTSVLNYVSDSMDGLILEINSHGPGGIYGDFISNLIDLMKPDVLLVNDFDRIPNTDSWLAMLESVRDQLKLVMITINSADDIDTALLRPGRFDEYVRLDEPDEEIYQILIKGVPEEYKEKIRAWPAAYINELKERIEMFGLDNVEEEFKELDKRTKMLDDNDKPADNNKSLDRRPRKIRGPL